MTWYPNAFENRIWPCCRWFLEPSRWWRPFCSPVDQWHRCCGCGQNLCYAGLILGTLMIILSMTCIVSWILTLHVLLGGGGGGGLNAASGSAYAGGGGTTIGGVAGTGATGGSLGKGGDGSTHGSGGGGGTTILLSSPLITVSD